MTNYMKWCFQSRALVFSGAGLLLIPTFTDGLVGEFSKILSIVGMILVVFGNLYGLGLIRRKWVKAAIREENERMRPGLVDG